MADIVEVRAKVGRDSRLEETMLTCFDPEGVLRPVEGGEGASCNLWAERGPGWWQAEDDTFATPYALGEGWQSRASFTVLTSAADGAEYTGEWRLEGDEVGALWQAEQVRRFVGEEWVDLWELYIAPGDLTPGLEHDIVGLRRLALPVSAWLITLPAVGDGVSFEANNLYIGRPPAPNFYPRLQGWGEGSIYDRMRLTGRSAF